MNENLVLVNYKVESEAYQALSELKRDTANANYTISQAVIVKRENGQLNTMDGFINGKDANDDTVTGSLIGGLVGILGGPIGILLGGSVGMLIGGAVDASGLVKDASLLEKAGDSIAEGETAIILLAQEEYETALTAKLNDFDVTITRSRTCPRSRAPDGKGDQRKTAGRKDRGIQRDRCKEKRGTEKLVYTSRQR